MVTRDPPARPPSLAAPLPTLFPFLLLILLWLPTALLLPLCLPPSSTLRPPALLPQRPRLHSLPRCVEPLISLAATQRGQDLRSPWGRQGSCRPRGWLGSELEGPFFTPHPPGPRFLPSPPLPMPSSTARRSAVSRAEAYRKSASHLAVHMRTRGPETALACSRSPPPPQAVKAERLPQGSDSLGALGAEPRLG